MFWGTQTRLVVPLLIPSRPLIFTVRVAYVSHHRVLYFESCVLLYDDCIPLHVLHACMRNLEFWGLLTDYYSVTFRFSLSSEGPWYAYLIALCIRDMVQSLHDFQA